VCVPLSECIVAVNEMSRGREVNDRVKS